MLAGADFNLNANLRNTPTVLEHTLSMPTATRMLEVYLARLMNHLVPGSPPPPPPPPGSPQVSGAPDYHLIPTGKIEAVGPGSAQDFWAETKARLAHL